MLESLFNKVAGFHAYTFFYTTPPVAASLNTTKDLLRVRNFFYLLVSLQLTPDIRLAHFSKKLIQQ